MQYKQWLECSGGTMFYFDKVFDLGSGMRIEIDNFNLISSTSATTVFLEFDSNNEEEDYEYLGFEKGQNKNGVWVLDGPNQTDVISIDNNTPYNVVFTNNSLSINGVTKTYSRTWLADFNRLCINGSYDYEYEEFYHNPSETKVRYGEIRYYDNNNLLVWLRPCVNNDTVCFFDFISKTYLTAFGGTPTAGPDYVRPVTGTTVPINKYKVGSTSINKQQRGDDNVNKMYMGNDLVYQKFSFAPTLSISVDSMEFKYSGDTAQVVNVNSNTEWTYTTDAEWLNITESGNTLSVVPDNYSSELENRTATITITADNGDIVKTKTISVTQKKVPTYTQLEWIGSVNTGTSWDSQAKLNTMVPHTTTDMTIRFKYKWQPNYSSGYSDRMIGYSYQFNDDIATNIYRIFAYSDGSFDNWNDRTSYLGLLTNNQYYDITFADNYVYDNINNTYLSNKTPVGSVPSPGCKIFVDLSFPIYGVEIKNGNTLVFDGVPAMDDDGHVGLWDNVTSQLYYNPNYTMTYGEL